MFSASSFVKRASRMTLNQRCSGMLFSTKNCICATSGQKMREVASSRTPLLQNIQSPYTTSSRLQNGATRAPDPKILKQVLPTSARAHPLDKIFKPESVALIGASEKEGSVGKSILSNLLRSAEPPVIYPINFKRKSVMGIVTYKTVADIPQKEPVDLAVICIPAPHVVAAVRQCAEAGIKGVVVISAGFSEAGEDGHKWAAEIQQIGKQNGMKIIGPNCIGVASSGFNATFATTGIKKGRVGLISQSGAIASSMLDYAEKENLRFSKFCSIGSMLDVDFGDLIDYYGQDSETEAIVIYMESVGNAKKFMAAASSVALTKPIILIRVGKTEAGAKAAASHTGTMAGADNVLNAAFKRSGVLRVDNVDDLFGVTEILAKQPRPQGNKLTVVTNAGGPGILCADSLIENGGLLSPLSKQTIEELNNILPEHWSHSNPIDILGDAPPKRYADALHVAMQDIHTDGVLVILTPQSMTNSKECAEEIIKAAKGYSKPLFCCFMGGEEVEAGRRLLAQNNIPTYSFPDQAAKNFALLHKYSSSIDVLFQNAGVAPAKKSIEEENVDAVRQILSEARDSGRYTLSEHESKEILRLYGITTTEIHIANSPEEAVEYAEKIGYPVVLKLHSHTITHKIDVGGVRLNLRRKQDVEEAFVKIRDAVPEKDFLGCSVQPMETVREGYELIVGCSSDPQFGPVVLFGTGGSFVEVYADTTLAIPPISYDIAQRMIDSTKISKILKGYRGREPVSFEQLQRTLVRFSRLIMDHSSLIKEVDINPLLASNKKLVALDARVLLFSKDEKAPSPALRAFPREYSTRFEELDLAIRHVRVRDFNHILRFFARVSESLKALGIQEKALQYTTAFTQMKKAEKEHLTGKTRQLYNSLRRLCIGNIEKEAVMIAETDEGRVVALTRYNKTGEEGVAEMAVILDPEYQKKGLGSFMMDHLLHVARKEGIHTMRAIVATYNEGFIKLSSKMGFQEVGRTKKDVTLELKL